MIIRHRDKKMVQSDDLTYYKEARDWESSRVALLERSESRAWKVAIATTVMAVTAVLAVAMLSPLKSAIPFLIYVDKMTGDTRVQVAMESQPVEFSEVLDKHWVGEYVISRERYLWELLQFDYDRTHAFSGEVPAREYEKLFDGADAIHKVMGKGHEYAIRLISITMQNRTAGAGGVAVVRFEKVMRSVGATQNTSVSRYVANLSYKYEVRRFSKEKTAMMNPMGFTVTAYRVDPELADVTPSKSPSATPSSAPSESASPLPNAQSATGNSGNANPTGSVRP
ncbi:virB8 family protein [Cupriavidus necator]